MKSITWYSLWIVAVSAIALAITGCGDDGSSGEGGGGGGGAGADTAIDEGADTDAATDAGAATDAATDSATDAATDSATDSATDAATDARDETDADADTATDEGVDSDAATDAATDAGDETDGGGGETGSAGCEEASDCVGEVCVALIDNPNPPVYCSEPCTADSCPDGFICDESTFRRVGLSFCRFGEAGTEPEAPAEPPRLPCVDDDDCEGAQVCAEYDGERDCTIACAAEEECTPPAVGGITFDVATCAPDQRSDVTRDVCLPDTACYPNIQSCISGGSDIPGGGESPDIPGT